MQLEQFQQAELNARKAIELGQDDRAAYLALSTALIRLGNRDEALKIREQMPAIEQQTLPDDKKYQESFRKFASHNYALLGLAYISHDRLSQSEDLLLKSLTLEPTSLKGLTTLGDLFHRSGRLGDALRVYQRLIEVQPDNVMNYRNCASLAISMGELPLAEKVLRQAAEIDSSGYADLYLAKYLLSFGNFADASLHAKAAVDQSGDIDAYVTWIMALQAEGKTAFAVNALYKARELAPNDPRLANIKL